MNPQLHSAFGRLSTGTKMLIILSAAMLPLGIIALMTSLDMARSASIERRTAAQVTSAMYAAQIENVIDRGLGSTRAIAISDQTPDYLCAARARQADLNPYGRPPTAIFDAAGRKLCQSHGRPITRLSRADAGTDHVWLDAERGLFHFTSGRADGRLFVAADEPIAAIRPTIQQEEGLPLIRLALRQGSQEFELLNRGKQGDGGTLRLALPLADGRLALVADYRLAPARARTVLSVMLPILMWLSAAIFGWLIVSRLLLAPLAQLKRSIDTWQTTREPFSQPKLTTPSHEIRDLAESFGAATARIYEHERELEEGLARQTKLTREVHHRVKNNLQVVSSLINLHARGAEGPVADAYAAIQRRVDALAVVHRNHYAELEENRGVSMRALAGELATSLRASAPSNASGMPIALNMIDVNVTQDVAVPVSFLITEVVELLMYCNPEGSVLISLEATDQPDRATIRIESIGLAHSAIGDHPGLARFDRVVTGLARQFRAPLSQDLDIGRFEVQIGIIA